LLSDLIEEVKGLLKSIRKPGAFGNNLAISSGGTSLAYLFGFLLSPILARIYQPEAYGLYALFNAFVANLSIFATLEFASAFVLPKTEKEFIPLFQISIFSLILVTALSGLGILLFKEPLLIFFNATSLEGLIFLVPIVVFFIGINRCLEYWNIRRKDFKQGARSKVIGVVGAKLITLGFGLVSKGNPLGFIIGDLFAKPLTSVSLLSSYIRSNWRKLLRFSWNHLRIVAKEYKDYPLYNLPGNTLITLGTQLPVYLIAYLFSTSEVGQFSLANSLINAPVQLVGLAFAQVFFQKVSELNHRKPSEISLVTKKYFRVLNLVAVMPFAIIVVFGSSIFKIVFGTEWELAGRFASIMGTMAYLTFISVSVNSLYRVMRIEKLQFYIVLGGSVRLSLALLSATSFDSVIIVIVAYSIASSVLQLVLMGTVLRKVGLNPLRQVFEAISIMVLTSLFFYGLGEFIGIF